MATAPKLVDPPFYDAPIVETLAGGQQHSQAWTEYHQSLSDQVNDLAVAATKNKGVTDGSDAVAGDIGEYLFTPSGASVGLSNGALANICSLDLTPGDWDVAGNVIFNPTGAVTFAAASCSTASVTLNVIAARVAGSAAANQLRLGTGGDQRINVSADTTVYLVAQCGFTSGSVSATGTIWGRRVR
jgi:hypothetical protein